jgi:hypothetical protein
VEKILFEEKIKREDCSSLLSFTPARALKWFIEKEGA